MEKLSKKQQEVYNFLVEYTTEHLYPPSIREICDGVALSSTSSAFTHIRSLERKGYIQCLEGSPRAIKLVGYQFTRI